VTRNSGRRVRLVTAAVGVAGILIATATAAAQDISVNFGQGNWPTKRVIQRIALSSTSSSLRC
jgi:carbohydrate-selective porin OprB